MQTSENENENELLELKLNCKDKVKEMPLWIHQRRIFKKAQQNFKMRSGTTSTSNDNQCSILCSDVPNDNQVIIALENHILRKENKKVQETI